ncbi:MAG TPA: DUF3810 domain-containing protein [Phnomibacter sp.]|nr:DUF3810 domain-containing protein [Phnomibacter sp.]
MNSKAHHRKEKIAWLVLLCCLLLTVLATSFPVFIERVYANGIYPHIASAMRLVFGWIPFSVGDLLIGLLILYVIRSLYRGIVKIRRKQWHWKSALFSSRKILFAVLSVYVMFHVLWGFNYYRLGSAHLLKIQPEEYSNADVDSLLQTLNHKLGELNKDSAGILQHQSKKRSELLQDAMSAYNAGTSQFSFLQFNHASLKPNALGPLQSYTGYSGYLFPFTAEAQVNFNAPTYTLPFTVCHEMAHQLGFGSESEANMIGFLACRSSTNIAFVYSAYADMHGYALHEMWKRDSVRAKQLNKEVPAILKQHRKEFAIWAKQHESFMQPVLNYVYQHYLYSTNQPQGLQSYNRVVAWLIAYAKKYGWAKI